MNSPLPQTPPSAAATFAKPWAPLILAALLVQGCAVAPVQFTRAYEPPPVVPAPVAAVPPAPVQAASDEVDLMPPLPSFTTLADCESAYGPNACGNGQAVYLSAGITAPVGSDAWFIPYAFGAMTGVLINHYFAPPAPFVARVDYHAFTARVVVNRYKVINRTQIDRYRHAPAEVRSRLAHIGPGRYSPSRGVVTHKLAPTTAPRLASAAPHRPVEAAPADYGHKGALAASGRPRSVGPGADERGRAHAVMPAQSPSVRRDSEGGRVQARQQPLRRPVSPPQQARAQGLHPDTVHSMPPRAVVAGPHSAARPAARPAAQTGGQRPSESLRRS
jgi:hypothetical protein